MKEVHQPEEELTPNSPMLAVWPERERGELATEARMLGLGEIRFRVLWRRAAVRRVEMQRKNLATFQGVL